MLVKEIDRLVMLMEEIAILKSRLQPHDTGHIHTTINTLEHRVEDLMRKREDMPFKFELTQGDDLDSYGC